MVASRVRVSATAHVFLLRLKLARATKSKTAGVKAGGLSCCEE